MGAPVVLSRTWPAMRPVSTIVRGRGVSRTPSSKVSKRTGCRAMASPGGGVQKRRSDLCGRHSLSVSTFPGGGDARRLGPRDVGEVVRTVASRLAFLLPSQCLEHLFRRDRDLVDPHAGKGAQ